MSDLAGATALSASRMTRLVVELQSRGLVTKRVSADDGRGHVAILTPAGLAKVKAGQGVHVSSLRTLVFDHVDAAHMPDAARALSGIVALAPGQALRRWKGSAISLMTVDGPARKRAAIADPDAREFLRSADPVLAELIDGGRTSATGVDGRASPARRLRHTRLPGCGSTTIRGLYPGHHLSPAAAIRGQNAIAGPSCSWLTRGRSGIAGSRLERATR